MLATRATPPILAALALLLATPVPRQRAPEPEPAPASRVVVVEPAPMPRAIVIDPGPGLAGDVITPGYFRDAEPWPHGMVIKPQAPRVALAAPADDLWSGFIRPLADALLAPASTLL